MTGRAKHLGLDSRNTERFRSLREAPGESAAKRRALMRGRLRQFGCSWGGSILAREPHEALIDHAFTSEDVSTGAEHTVPRKLGLSVTNRAL